MINLSIDGQPVDVPEGTTILSACASIGTTIPTLCFLETLKPVNVCRLCVVEVEGARVLAPSCSRAAAGARAARIVCLSIHGARHERAARRIRMPAGTLWLLGRHCRTAAKNRQ